MFEKDAEDMLDVKDKEGLILSIQNMFLQSDYSSFRPSVRKQLKEIFKNDSEAIPLQPRFTLSMGAKVLAKFYNDSILDMLANHILIIPDKYTMQRAFEQVKQRLIEIGASNNSTMKH